LTLRYSRLRLVLAGAPGGAGGEVAGQVPPKMPRRMVLAVVRARSGKIVCRGWVAAWHGGAGLGCRGEGGRVGVSGGASGGAECGGKSGSRGWGACSMSYQSSSTIATCLATDLDR